MYVNIIMTIVMHLDDICLTNRWQNVMWHFFLQFFWFHTGYTTKNTKIIIVLDHELYQIKLHAFPDPSNTVGNISVCAILVHRICKQITIGAMLTQYLCAFING